MKCQLEVVIPAAAAQGNLRRGHGRSSGLVRGRDGNDVLRIELEQALDRQGPAIRAILDEFGIPLVPTVRANDSHASVETR